MTAREHIEELVQRETRAWDTQDVDLLLTIFHPDMVWPWPPSPTAHDPADWLLEWGRYDERRWREGWSSLFAEYRLVHNRRDLVRVVVSDQEDCGFAVVDVDTLWESRAGEPFHWLGRACKIYTLAGDAWKMIGHTGLLAYPSPDAGR